MDKMNSITNERVCDLVDGHVLDGEYAQAFEALLSDKEAVQTWHAYLVIGDVLRSAELAPTSSNNAFLERLERRLAQEPIRPVVTEDAQVVGVTRSGLPSANASVFRWKMVAAVASFALLGVVGLGLWTQSGQPGDVQQMAAQSFVVPRAPASTLVAADADSGPMLRDARLDELMAAHRQLGGHSALQVPAGFLRNATYEGSDR
jgi:sigma-E factor negative regulatory protein RseA